VVSERERERERSLIVCESERASAPSSNRATRARPCATSAWWKARNMWCISDPNHPAVWLRETDIETESVCALTLLQSGNPCKAVRHVRLVEGAKHVVSESEM